MIKITDDYLHNFVKKQEYKLKSKIWDARANRIGKKLDKIDRSDVIV